MRDKAYLDLHHQLMLVKVEALLALLLGDWLAAAIMLGLLFVNVGTTVYQTRQSDAVFASLAPEDSVWATVVRDGQKQEIPARELVPGDIVYLGEVSCSYPLSFLQFSSNTA